jgi:hypothetical protein
MNQPNLSPLELARKQLEKVHAAVWDDVDWDDLTIYGFYCLENAVVAASEHVGRPVKRNHPDKAAAASELATNFGLPDVSGLLRTLNEARKSASYGDMPLPPLDPQDLVQDIEAYVEAVAEMLDDESESDDDEQ